MIDLDNINNDQVVVHFRTADGPGLEAELSPAGFIDLAIADEFVEDQRAYRSEKMQK